MTIPAKPARAVAVRPAVRRRAALSLQTRAVVLIALGILAISGYVAMAISNDTAVASNYRRAAQYRQLQVDNLNFMYGMVNQQSGIAGYVNTADQAYLASYKLGRERASSVRDRLRAEARAAGLGAAIDTTLRFEAEWQTWAEERKSAVDQEKRPLVDTTQAARGNELFEAMRSADDPISEVAEAQVSDALTQAASKLALEYTVLTVGGLVAMVSLILLLVYFLLGVLRPVARLARVAEQLAEDEDVRVPLSNSGSEVGELTRALAAWQYSSAERLALTQLAAESESRFRLLFDRAPIGIARLARSGRIIETNSALQEMLGRAPDELAGMNAADLVQPAPKATGDGFLKGLESAQEHLQQERLLVKKDGSPFWADVTVSVVRGAGGEFQYIVAMFEDVTDRKRQAEALEHRALHDSLTDLPNRTLLFDRLRQAVLAAKREDQTMALLIMDLDGFKEINDTYGHQAGDVVLKQLAKRLRSRVRDSDTVARMGGDEFAFVLAGDDQAGAAEAAARLMGALQTPFTVKGKRLEVGASIGVAVFPQDGVHPDTLLREADEAMYRAKRAGGGYAVSRTG